MLLDRPDMAITLESGNRPRVVSYSVRAGASRALQSLLAACDKVLPEQIRQQADNVLFSSKRGAGDQIHFPTPLREQDATAAIKALEASVAAAFANFRYGEDFRAIDVDLDKTSCFLMSAYILTIDGMDKANPKVRERIPDTDFNKAQSVLYRRLSANLYETKTPGEYYHIHGSLDATKTLEMLGLPAFAPDLTGYRECIDKIEAAVKQFTVQELEQKNQQQGQAGIPVLTWSDFQRTSHGKALKSLPPLTVTAAETVTPPVPFDPHSSVENLRGSRHALSGIKVIEMCRVIAGPTIGRLLAAHGATVLKVTCPSLPDVPFFQLDVNTGKHTTSLNLRDPIDRETFDALLADADVFIDGYRPGCLAKLGYGPDDLVQRAKERHRGIVYVAEDCFGGAGVSGAEWFGRPGWQQIADCATGVAWAQGRFMGLSEPVVPPFPMSDYGTGALGCVAAMTGLFRRATEGGSWICRTSLCQYDVFLMNLGTLPLKEQARLRRTHDAGFFELRHSDSVDEVGKRALKSVRRLHPHLFAEDLMHRAWSRGYGGELRWPREAIAVEGLGIGHVRASRPNGFDPPSWEGWEEDEELVTSTMSAAAESGVGAGVGSLVVAAAGGKRLRPEIRPQL